MSIFPEPTAVKFDDDAFWVSLSDGRVIGVPIAWYPRLLKGTPEQRRDFFLSPSGMHWELLDKDISVRGILASHIEFSPEARDAA